MQIEEFEFVNYQFLGLEFHVLALTYIVEGSTSLHLASRIDRRNLPNGSTEPAQSLFDRSLGNMTRGINGIDGMFGIKRGCGAAQTERCHIFLCSGLQLVNLFRALARAKDHHTTGQRVQGPRMSHLQAFQSKATTQIIAHYLHQIE